MHPFFERPPAACAACMWWGGAQSADECTKCRIFIIKKNAV